MLLSFCFENFRSFKDKTTLSMIATTQRTLNDVLIRKGKHRILPSAVLYGANASGKSNVILAMLALRTIVKNGSIAHTANKIISSMELFPFVHDNNADPITFEIEFIEGEDQFIYRLSIDVEPLKKNGKRRILEECLNLVLPKRSVMLFHRTEHDIFVGNDSYALNMLQHQDTKALQNLVGSIIKNMDEEALFLTGGFKSTISKAVADKVIDHISEKILSVMDLSDMLLDSTIIATDDPVIASGSVIQEKLFDAIVSAADFGPQQIFLRAKENNDQGIKELKMISQYRKTTIPSELMESAGTIKLLRFSLLLRQFIAQGGLLMIDEMDNAIHPEIMKAIIALFGNPEVNKNGAQLIFTTHNPIFMDHDLLRRDQILFTERDPDTYESTLHSLGDFGSISVRNDQSFMRNYFKGRYGRLPYIDLEAVLTHVMED